MTQATASTTPILAARYRIEERLGANRLAAVYRAFDERLQRAVLVHMLRKDLVGQEPLRQRFIQEAHASARRSHQSLLELFDSGEIAQRPYMITEYVAGRTIADLGALSLEEALLYFRQLVGAVAACQQAGVQHPPISSRNLILVADGHIELVESWMTPHGELSRDLASYRPPERTEGQPPTPASTVYSLGLLLLEMLSGKRVFTGEDPRTVADQHLNAVIPALATLRPALRVPPLEQIIAKATARQPADRYADAATLGRAVDELWRAFSSETQRLAQPAAQRPKLREQMSVASQTIAPRPVAVPLVKPEIGTEADLHALPPVRKQSRRRSLVGLVVMLSLFGAAGVLAYSLATAAVNQLTGFQLPQPSLDLPAIPANLPEWLTGVVSGGEQVFVVSGVSEEGLNLRDKPGVDSTVIGLLPNGTLMRKIGGPQTENGVAWLRVRARVGDQELEGWVSQRFIKPMSNNA